MRRTRLPAFIALALFVALTSMQAFGPSADAAFTDTDGDGASDVAEEILDSNPNSASSTPEVGATLAFLALPDLPGVALSCSDGVDNDGDGAIDVADSGCLDEDGDGLTDALELTLGSDPADEDSFPEDSRFASLFGGTPYAYIFASYCADGDDNDGDGLVDAADPGCGPADEDNDTFDDILEKPLGSDWQDAGSTPEHISINPGSCKDGLDNDGDGDIDASDPGCAVAPNDDFADALVIDSLPFSHTAKVGNATVEFGERVSDCSGFLETPELRATVWYRFTAPADTHLLIDATGTDIISFVSVWRQGSFGLEEVDCISSFFYFGTPSRLAVPVSAGDTYYVQVERLISVPDLPVIDLARFSVHFDSIAPPSNDDFADAEPITSLPFDTSVDTLAATTEPGEPDATCRFQGFPTSSVWYRYTPTVDTYVRAGAGLFATDFGATIGVFEGPTLASLDQVACGSENLAFHALAGHTYYIQAAGYTCRYSGDGAGSIASFCIDSRSGHLELHAEEFTLPLCGQPGPPVPDPTGDTKYHLNQAPPVDVSSIAVALSHEAACITVRFAQHVPQEDIWVDAQFDADDDPATGNPLRYRDDCPPMGIGADFEARAQGANGLQTRVGTPVAFGPAYTIFGNSTLTLVLPRAIVGSTAKFKLAVFTYFGGSRSGQFSDCVPNGGNISCQNTSCVFVPFRNGDANCEAGANAVDAAVILQHSAGLLPTLPCPEAADVDGNSAINSLDAALILQFGAGLVFRLPPIPCERPPEFCWR